MCHCQHCLAHMVAMVTCKLMKLINGGLRKLMLGDQLLLTITTTSFFQHPLTDLTVHHIKTREANRMFV